MMCRTYTEAGRRVGLPPQWYPTHSNAYYVGVTGGSFTEVSCLGTPSTVAHLQPANNPYKNSFGTEIAMFRTTEGGMSRMGVSWEDFKKAAAENTPLRRTGKPEDIASVIAFLCSEDSSFVSGQTIYVRGGP